MSKNENIFLRQAKKKEQGMSGNRKRKKTDNTLWLLQPGPNSRHWSALIPSVSREATQRGAPRDRRTSRLKNPQIE